uniref:Uncharacterized protein n=1 Tax=Anguilla anguilla TaxID=7936 RepID=A0A0E9S6T5_ANGAN
MLNARLRFSQNVETSSIQFSKNKPYIWVLHIQKKTVMIHTSSVSLIIT